MRLVPLLALLALAAAPPARGESPPDQVRGIVLSTHTNGSDWGSPGIRSTLEEIRELGADWISIHPYARIEAGGNIRSREFDPEHPPEYLTHPIREAHALGLRILIQPHVAYWGSPYSWPGEITFDNDPQWRRFFTTYGAWICRLAEALDDADAFVVGTELDRTVAHEHEWRHLIENVRARTSVPLTYAANWTSYREVPFWDALDVVGIQAYFPVADSAGATDPEIRAGWDRVLREIREFGGRENRRVVFTELGYNRSFEAAVRPWEYGVDGPEAEAMQVRCYRIALAAIREEPTIAGAFLWKWFPNPRPVGRNFQLATPALRRVISDAWNP